MGQDFAAAELFAPADVFGRALEAVELLRDGGGAVPAAMKFTRRSIWLRIGRPNASALRSARLLFSDQPRVDAKLAFRLLCSSNMKEWDVSARKVTRQAAFALGCFVLIQLVGVRSAGAESPRKVQGFEVLGTLGYGVAVGDVRWNYRGQHLAIDPYGVMLGLDIGYTLPFGLRIGADASHGFGRTIETTLPTGEAVAVHSSSFAWGGSVGYDLLLSSFRLRGAAEAGLVVVDVEDRPGAMYYIGPSVALIWQYRDLELGLQSRYWKTSDDGPGNTGFVQVGLVSGARF